MPDVPHTTFAASGTVGELVIQRPRKRNPVSRQVLQDLEHALEHCRAGGQQVLVIRGAQGFFSAGADLDELSGSAIDREWFDLIARTTLRLASSDVVTIAAIEGGCLGSGLDLAVACDLRVAAPDSFFALPALEMGLVYRPETFRRIAGLAGPTTAMRLAVLGQRISGTDAHRLGLITHVGLDVMTETSRLAEECARMPATTLLQTVRLLNGLADAVPIADPWRRWHLDSLASDERKCAVSSKRQSMRRETV